MSLDAACRMEILYVYTVYISSDFGKIYLLEACDHKLPRVHRTALNQT